MTIRLVVFAMRDRFDKGSVEDLLTHGGTENPDFFSV